MKTDREFAPDEQLHVWRCENPRCVIRQTDSERTMYRREGLRHWPQPDPDPRTRLMVRLPKHLNLTDGLSIIETGGW